MTNAHVSTMMLPIITNSSRGGDTSTSEANTMLSSDQHLSNSLSFSFHSADSVMLFWSFCCFFHHETFFMLQFKDSFLFVACPGRFQKSFPAFQMKVCLPFVRPVNQELRANVCKVSWHSRANFNTGRIQRQIWWEHTRFQRAGDASWNAKVSHLEMRQTNTLLFTCHILSSSGHINQMQCDFDDLYVCCKYENTLEKFLYCCIKYATQLLFLLQTIHVSFSLKWHVKPGTIL